MSSSNPINLYGLDGRYVTPSGVDAKISAQASTDSALYATQSSVSNKAAKGANADITSLTGLTTALSVGQGGTGSTSAASARTALGVDASGTQEPTLSVAAWAPSTAYVKGQLALSPLGAITANVTSLIQANSSFTSGASFNAGNWTQLSDVNLPIGTAAGTVAAGNDSRLAAVSANTAAITALTLNPTATQTTTYAAAAQDLVLADATSGGFTVTLPTAPADKTLVEVKKLDASVNTVTVSTGSGDTFSIGGTSLALALQGQGVTWRYQSSTSKWIALNNDLPLAAVDGRYVSYRGTWAAGTAYIQNSMVIYSGGLFLATAAVPARTQFYVSDWQALYNYGTSRTYADNFNRAVTTSGLGITSTGAVSWIETGGSWGINASGQAYSAGGAAGARATIDVGTANMTVQVTSTGSNDTGTGVIFRDDGSTFGMLLYTGNYYTYANSTFSNQGTVSGLAWSAGDTIKIVLVNSVGIVYKNGTQLGTITNNNYGTRGGMRVDSSTPTWDNFSISPS